MCFSRFLLYRAILGIKLGYVGLCWPTLEHLSPNMENKMTPRPSNLESRWPKVAPRHPAWSHHALQEPQLASKLDPPTHQKTLEKNIWFLKVFAISTNLQHDAQHHPNIVAKTSQHGSHDGPRHSNLEPRWPQDPPKLEPRWPKVGPRGPQIGKPTFGF